MSILRIRKHQKHRNYLVALLAIFIPAVITAAAWITTRNNVSAYLDGFDPGNIMSDSVMANKSSMTERQIQDFLKSKNPCNDRDLNKAKYYQSKGYQYTIKDGHFVCMADDTFNGETAAHIIWQAAQDYNVNPQVLIVLLEKEQGLVTDTWPNDRQYSSATGFGCPDTAACDASYSGLKKQVRSAASFFHEVLSGGWSNYPVGRSYVQYHPNASCGGTIVDIKNRATSALYRYTPYQPNKAALDAGIGIGDSCSSYGNRNFYNMFTKWFGSAHEFAVTGGIAKRYDQIKGMMGRPVGAEFGGNGVHYQEFENGFIVGSDRTGYWESKGEIRKRWAKLKYDGGSLGLPTGPEVWDGKGWWQMYQNGAIIGTTKTGFWESMGAIRGRWAQLGYQNGSMGYPTSEIVWDGKGWWQMYQNGAIIGTTKTGFWESRGMVRAKWAELGYQNGKAGYPTSAEIYDSNSNSWRQTYEHGVITHYAGGKSFFAPY